MPEEEKESRIEVEDLTQSERELSPEEAKKVQGGITNQTVEAGASEKASLPRRDGQNGF